ncbi:hypothetical protein DH2020_046232 [Rehmannia glutinosa]|uniref:Uncharacterized protein n=1 Tax=Rehmannia glutinosa TaxID=99300 RepID=A0ABR0UBS9_REHGL
MLVIVAILLIIGAVVRCKLKNEAAKKEEILRLVAMASEEEEEIASYKQLMTIIHHLRRLRRRRRSLKSGITVLFVIPPPLLGVLSAKLSGKCQIIHWRQGHKDDCRPATSLHASKESECHMEAVLENQFENNINNEAKICSDPTQQLDNSGSLSSSLPCFSSSSGQSETSFDASISEVLESATPIRQDKESSEGINSHMSRTTSDSDEVDVPSLFPLNSTVYAVKNMLDANKINRTQPTKPDEGFQTTSFKYKRSGNGADVLKEFGLGTTELRSSKSSSSSKTSSSVVNHKNQAPSNGKITKSMYFRGSSNHNIDLRSTQCSKPLSVSSSEGYWKNEAQMVNGKETRSKSFRSSENDQKKCTKMGSTHTSLSEIEDVQVLSQPTSKILKTSVRKFVQHFRVPKQSKSHRVDTWKDSAGNYNNKIIFPPKLFMKLYSCDGVEFHPVGLMNCGNR